MSKLINGTRVICTRNSGSVKLGFKGKIASLDGVGGILVEFDDLTTGHDGMLYDGSKARWWCDDSMLEVLSDEMPMLEHKLPQFFINEKVVNLMNDLILQQGDKGVVVDRRIIGDSYAYKVKFEDITHGDGPDKDTRWVPEEKLVEPWRYVAMQFQPGARVKLKDARWFSNEWKTMKGYVVSNLSATLEVKWDNGDFKSQSILSLELVTDTEFKKGDKVWYKKRDGEVKHKSFGVVTDDSFMPYVQWADGTISSVSEGDLKLMGGDK